MLAVSNRGPSVVVGSCWYLSVSVALGRFSTFPDMWQVGVCGRSTSSKAQNTNSNLTHLKRVSQRLEERPDSYVHSMRPAVVWSVNVQMRPPALKWYRAKCNLQAEIEEMQEEQRSLSSVATLSVWRLLHDDTVRWQVLSVVVINVGMQLSGIDAVSN